MTQYQRLKPDIAPINLNRCTYDITGKRNQVQYYRRCLDCFHGEGSGVCLNCISVCHAGHRIEDFVRTGSLFCDCGAGTSLKNRCKLVGQVNLPSPRPPLEYILGLEEKALSPILDNPPK